MSSFSGMGANLAMCDGADLAKALAEHVTVTAYEKILIPRSVEAAEGPPKASTALSPPTAPSRPSRT